ncbi:N-acetylmuramic acid 6-phosphate etherase [Paenibacillus sp. RC67]|uniref:N-acetylmuramic acid 6-phosphate etherase n=1 Tax=Paenibacillus sp. RC67 TaxID=3039392 RepID=UPI0024AE1AE1|nr:N-acetylmuramic acid 6-phosphate etherase [Paenibacillus sp. RC67]
MGVKLEGLTTEMRNTATANLDQLSVIDVLRLMNAEDKKVAFAVEEQLKPIATAVEIIVAGLKQGGRLFYFGAGTSGRLGVLDASECPPTFGTNPAMIQGIIAGGRRALTEAIEGAEDSTSAGVEAVNHVGVTIQDVVVGIAASGRTPYVKGVLERAKAIGASTVLVSCNNESEINELADVAINVVVGPEVVTGSTRLKAGTAQKMVLNMLTTAAMIGLGKVYENLMINVQSTNYKLKERVKRIVMEATGVNYEEAERVSEAANGDARLAILMQMTGIPAQEAEALLHDADGNIREAMRIQAVRATATGK